MSSTGARVEYPRQIIGRLRSAAAPLLLPSRIMWLITLIGGLLRLYRYDALSLWVDEGLTAQFARLPWDTVLGLHGAYETHPPLYFALVKAAELFAPELTAGRLVSLIAGTLTLPLVYALGARMIGQWGAALATLALAFSPLHIWYSQEARPYALCVLIVGAGYLALVGFHQSGNPRWSILYGVSVLVALYAGYSTIYALAPQGALLIYLLITHKKRALWLWLAGALGVAGFLPWLPQLLTTIHKDGARQAEYLSVSADKVTTSVLSILGIDGQASYFWGSVPAAWDRWPTLQTLMIVVAIAVCVAGVIGLRRRSIFGLLAAICLFGGTIGSAIVISLISAGYAERTVVYALLGWVLMIGAAPSVRTSRISGWVVAVSLSCIFFLSLVSLWAIYRGGDKQHWRNMAQDALGIEKSGALLLIYPTVAGTLFDVYHPRSFDNAVTIADYSELPDVAQPESGAQSLWLAYLEVGGIAHLRDQLTERGYHLVQHNYYWNPLYLDLYQATNTPR